MFEDCINVCDVQINTLYSLEDIDDRYWLTRHNRVYDNVTGKLVNVRLTNFGYPSVDMKRSDGSCRSVTMHKIIALARINNGPYECIEHLNDIPWDLRVSNLCFPRLKETLRELLKMAEEIVPLLFFE